MMRLTRFNDRWLSGDPARVGAIRSALRSARSGFFGVVLVLGAIGGIAPGISSAAVTISSIPDPGPLQPGERFDVWVEVGTDEEPVDGMFGIAFRLEFDRFAFVPIDVSPAELFPGGNSLLFAQPDAGTGIFAYSQTVVGDAGITGFGPLARFEFEVLSDAGSGSYSFPILRLEMIDLRGENLPTVVAADETTIEGDARGACCLDSGACIFVTEFSCGSEGGLYLGDDTGCDLDPCGSSPGNLLVQSVPDGAAIFLDGNLTGEVTPFLFRDLAVGTHCVEWYLPGHGGCRSDQGECPGLEVEVTESDTTLASCALVPYFVSVVPRSVTLAPPTVVLPTSGRQSHTLVVDLAGMALPGDVDPSVAYLGNLAVVPDGWSLEGGSSIRFALGSEHLIHAAQDVADEGVVDGDPVVLPLRLPLRSGAWFETDLAVRLRSLSDISVDLPQSMSAVAFPNPFQTQVSISWDDPDGQPATIMIGDVTGRQVATLTVPSSGSGSVDWDGRVDGVDLPNGVYQYRVLAGEREGRGRVLLLR